MTDRVFVWSPSRFCLSCVFYYLFTRWICEKGKMGLGNILCFQLISLVGKELNERVKWFSKGTLSEMSLLGKTTGFHTAAQKFLKKWLCPPILCVTLPTVFQSRKSAHPMQQSEMTLTSPTRTRAMDYLSIWLHNRIMELEDELPCKPGRTSCVCVHLNLILCI